MTEANGILKIINDKMNFTADDIENELNIKLTDQQKKYFNNMQISKYVFPKSNYQISTLLTKLNRPATYYRLCQLICKFQKSWNFADITYLLLKNKKLNDADIFEKLFSNVRDIQTVREYSKEYVANYLLNILNNLTIENSSIKFIPKSYLDIGCGTGILTRDFGKTLGITNENIVGADVEDEFEESWKITRPKEIKYYIIKNGKLDIGRKFDVVTCMMVLHHVPLDHLNKYILDIYNLLNSDGIFIIKEHDCFNVADYIIADLEHSFYISQEYFAANPSSNKKLSDAAKQKIFDQVIYYKDRFTWKIIIQRAGFKCIYEKPYDTGLAETYAPNRAYVAVFKKIE